MFIKSLMFFLGINLNFV